MVSVLHIYSSGALHPLNRCECWRDGPDSVIYSEWVPIDYAYIVQTSSCWWWCNKLAGLNGDESVCNIECVQLSWVIINEVVLLHVCCHVF